MKRKLLVSITTTQFYPRTEPQAWLSKIEEIKFFGIQEVAFFPTCLDPKQRVECYRYLETVKNLSIPFVHARSDMHPDEFQYLRDRFATKLFNLHSHRCRPLMHDLSEHQSMIAIENTGEEKMVASDIGHFCGLCLDLTHLEDDRKKNKLLKYESILSLMDLFPVRGNHIGPISSVLRHFPDDPSITFYEKHLMEDPSEFDYLQSYPERFFGELMAIEIENPITEQLKAKDYLENLIGHLV